MKLLFLRSQLADVEVGFRDGADIGDVKLGFDVGFGDLFYAARRRRSWGGGLGCRVAGCRTSRRGRNFGSDAADGFGDFLFERAALAGLHGHGREACENFESGGERCGSGLGAKHRRKRIGGLAAGAGGDDVVYGLLKLFAGALNALEVVAESASNGLFDGIGFWCHTLYWGVLPDVLPFCHCGVLAGERQREGGGGVTKRMMRNWGVGRVHW